MTDNQPADRPLVAHHAALEAAYRRAWNKVPRRHRTSNGTPSLPALIRAMVADLDPQAAEHGTATATEQLNRAWDEVPGEYVPEDDPDPDLAAAIRDMARDLEARSVNWQQVAVSRASAADDAYRRGRLELANELISLLLEFDKRGRAWHYVKGCLDIVTGKAEVAG